jgi:hypothetical protein
MARWWQTSSAGSKKFCIKRKFSLGDRIFFVSFLSLITINIQYSWHF